MKKRVLGIRIFLCVCAALGWWGILYPELTLTPDTYVVIDEDGAVHRAQDMVEWNVDSDIYRILLESEGRIHFKSKLLEQIDTLMEYLK